MTINWAVLRKPDLPNRLWSTISTGRGKLGRGPGALSIKTIQGAALVLESIHQHNIHCRHGFATSLFGVRHRVTDSILQEYLGHTTGLLDIRPEICFTPPRLARRRMGLRDTLNAVT